MKYKLESIPVEVRIIFQGEQNSLYIIKKHQERVETRQLISRDCGLVWIEVPAKSILEKVDYEETLFPTTTRIELGIKPYLEKGSTIDS